jgi:hypothetical protein
MLISGKSAMPKTLNDVRNDLLKLCPLPEGYSITCDYRTDNLLVDGPTLGFCVTRKAIDDNLHTRWFGPSVALLIATEKYASDTGCDPVKYPLIRLRSEKCIPYRSPGDCSFDEKENHDYSWKPETGVWHK